MDIEKLIGMQIVDAGNNHGTNWIETEDGSYFEIIESS